MARYDSADDFKDAFANRRKSGPVSGGKRASVTPPSRAQGTAASDYQRPQQRSSDNLDIDPRFRGLINSANAEERVQWEGWLQEKQAKEIGYTSNFWQNPHSVVRVHNAIQAGEEAPDWLKGQEENLDLVYRYMEQRNEGKPPQEWKYLNVNDPIRSVLTGLPTPPSTAMTRRERDVFAAPDAVKSGTAMWSDMAPDVRAGVLSDPDFYKSGITEYSMANQQAILADPNFDWSQMPEVDLPFGMALNWQKMYYGLSSSPAGMGAVQGGLMGLAVGSAPGAAIGAGAGAVLGAFAGWSGYDQTKEAWEQGDDVFTIDMNQFKDVGKGAFGWLNFLAEQAEKGIGMGMQMVDAAQDPNLALKDVMTKEGWNAGSVAFEVITPALLKAMQHDGELHWNDALNIVPTFHIVERLGDLILHPEKYKGNEIILGSGVPVKLEQDFQERIADARKRIEGGENYREVMTEFQNGIMAQIGDMAGQAIADPLNVMPRVQTAAVSKIAGATGHDVAAGAFRGQGNMLQGVAAYKADIAANRVPDGYKYSELNVMGRFFAGVSVDEAGKPIARAGMLSGKSILDTSRASSKIPVWNGIKKTFDYFTTMNPEARASMGIGLVSENMQALLTMFDNADDFADAFNRISKSDPKIAAELSAQFVGSPEMYTIIPAMEGFDIDNMSALWKSTESARSRMYQITEALGLENVFELRDELKKAGGAERMMKRISQADASTGAASILLNDIKNGDFGVEQLGKLGEIFNSESGAPLSYAEWSAVTANAMADHFANWSVKHFDLKPDTGVFRLAHTLKKAQSVLLLGFNPAYAMNNGINNMVTRVATGNFGYMMPKNIDAFVARLGIEPTRLSEGVGMFGDALRQANVDRPDAVIMKATKQKGVLTMADGVLRAVGDKTGLFQKLSSSFESIESKQGYAIGIKRAWSNIWQAGKGYRRMPKSLANALDAQVPGSSKIIREAVAAGMNMGEVRKAIGRGERAIRARNLVDEVASSMGGDPVQAATMLGDLGLMDALDGYLKGAKDERGVRAAFETVRRKAQENTDVKLTDEYKNKVEHNGNRIKAEGEKAWIEIYADNQIYLLERWLESYGEFGHIAEQIDMLEGRPDLQHALWSKAYDDNLRTWKRTNQAIYGNWEAMVQGMGLENMPEARSLLSKLAETHEIMREAFELRKNEHDTAGKPSERVSLKNRMEGQDSLTKVDAVFEKAFADVAKVEIEIGKEISAIVEMKYGQEAGDACRSMWVAMVDKRGDMTALLKKKRAEFRGMGRAERSAAKKAFYEGEYIEQINSLQHQKVDSAVELDRKISGRRGDGDGGDVTPAPDAPVDDPSSAGEVIPSAQDRVAEYFDDSPSPEVVAAEQGVFEIANEYGVAGAKLDENGLPVADYGANVKILNIVRKYGDPSTGAGQVRSFADLTPEMVRDAFEVRKLANSEQMPVREFNTPEANAAYDATRAKAELLAHSEEARAVAKVESEFVPEPSKDIESLIPEPVEGQAPSLFEGKYKDTHIADMSAEMRAALNYSLFEMEDLVRTGEPGKRAGSYNEAGEWVNAGTSSTYPDWFGGMKRNKEDVLIALTALREGMDKPKQTLYRELKMIAADLVQGNKIMAEQFGWAKAFGVEDTIIFNFSSKMDKLRVQIDRIDIHNAFALEQLPSNDVVRLLGDMPEEMHDMPSQYGGTMIEQGNKLFAFMDEKEILIRQEHAVAKQNADAKAHYEMMREYRDMVMNREILHEQAVEKFGYTEEQADVAMVAWEGMADYWSRETGRPKSEFYAEALAGVESGDLKGSGDLLHQRNSLAEQAKEYFGVTDNPKEAGYITPDGKYLDLSGRRDAVGYEKVDGEYRSTDSDYLANQRATDHREVSQFMDEIPGADSNTDYLVKFLSESGSVRMAYFGDNVLLDVGSPVTQRQIRKIASDFRDIGAMDIDITDPATGRTIKSFEFDNPSSREILNAFNEANTLLGGEATLYQRAMTGSEVEGYARALARQSVDDLRRAINMEDSKATRVALLDEVHKLAPDLAESVAVQVRDILFQDAENGVLGQMGKASEPKAGVSFLDDGRAIIHAFEGADFSSFMHESAHIFRRYLNEADLRVAEDWAGVVDGKWKVESEEKFARGFERYLADGEAPTPKLARVFESFKTWMTDIYKRVVGSPIDIEISPEMKQVFDGLLVEEQRGRGAEGQRLEADAFSKDFDFDAVDEVLFQDADPRLVDFDGFKTQMEAKYPDADMFLYERGNVVELNKMVFPDDMRGQGKGSAFMNDVLAYADANGKTVILTPDTSFGSTSKARLQEFYKRFGFVDNTGQNKDFSFRDSMYRYPAVDEGFASALTEMSDVARSRVVNSPEFRNWFGESKVVGESGEPLVVYHGTGTEFDVFDKLRAHDKEGRAAGVGFGKGKFYLTDDIGVANNWAENAPNRGQWSGKPVSGDKYGSGMEPRVMELYVRIENPISHSDYYNRLYDALKPFEEEYRFGVPQKIRDGVIAKLDKQVKKEGYDGIVGDGNIIPFDANQIKSVNNRGTFDPDNPNILFQDADPRFVDALNEMKEANAPQWYSRLEQVVEGMPQDKMPAQQFAAWMKKQSGIKADELKWTGFDDWLDAQEGTVTREDASAFLRDNKVSVEEVTKGEATNKAYIRVDDLRARTDIEPTKFEQYQLPGGENYRELLFTLPERDLLGSNDNLKWRQTEQGGWAFFDGETQASGTFPDEGYRDAAMGSVSSVKQRDNSNYSSSHWEESNVLAHTRFNERIDSNGNKVLFVEEVQSDWHQEGRSKGYYAETRDAASYSYTVSEPGMSLPDGERMYDVTRDDGLVSSVGALSPEEAISKIEAHNSILTDQALQSGVPDAPFAKTWHELVMKRMLRYAAENDFDSVAWTTGEQQVARYDLSKQVSELYWNPNSEVLYAYDLNGNEFINKVVPEKDLPDTVGKEVTRNLLDTPLENGQQHALKGEDLSIGGEGMRAFYNKMLPSYMSKYGKKWGAKVGEIQLYKNYGDPASMQAFREALTVAEERGNTAFVEAQAPSVLALPVTPEMKRSVMREGQVLFQDADPRMPTGGYENAAGVHFDGDVMEEGWAKYVDDLLSGMEESAIGRVNEFSVDPLSRSSVGFDDATQKELNRYMNQVKGDMATSKLASVRYGENLRDQAMLNYSRKYGFDRSLEVIFPYQFWYTRSMMNWGMRSLTQPAWFANYARLQQMQNRYENNLPERLRGKIQIAAPWMPEWMGQNLYVDPMKQIFPFANFKSPFEQMTRDNNYQVIEAERILQEWVADGQMQDSAARDAAVNRSGEVWEQAMAESAVRREAEISNGIDFIGAMLGPAWYLTTPAMALGLGKDGKEAIGETPMLKTARAFETVTRDTWIEPVGKLIGLLGKPEEMIREHFEIPTYGEYGEYYQKRQVANMVADGLITPEEAQMAMIEQKGDVWAEAGKRVDMEMAMRIPLAGTAYAGLHEGVVGAMQALPASLLGSGLLPAGELEYRGMKDEWDAAWKKFDAGDKQAITDFFEDNPEYESYLAKGKSGDEQLRSFLVGQIWDGYMGLDKTHQRQAGAELPPLFKQAFLDKETRSYESIPMEQLVAWSQMLGKMTPDPSSAGFDTSGEGLRSTQPSAQGVKEIDWYSKEITDVTDLYNEEKAEKFPFYYAQQSLYYSLPKSERSAYLRKNPELREYWDWKHKWTDAYPEYKDWFNGDVYKTIDTSSWSPILLFYVQDYAMTGQDLPDGAMKLLNQMWVREGKPYGTLEGWVSGSVAPSVLNQMR